MSLQANLSIRELLAMHPQTRSVFDRYGLKGCGGAEGPAESVGFFARAHGIELEVLLMELEQAIKNPESVPSDDNVDTADSIYRRFFKAGIITTLTAGAAWGALLLIKIGFKSSFTAISIFDVNAHGHAQIFGWVGLFVMGFAYQAFPRFRHTTLWNPPLAVFGFYLMIIGLVVRVFSEPLHQAILFFWLGVLGGAMELGAILLFVFVILRTIQQSQKPLLAYDYYIGAALFWFVVQAALDLFHLYQTTIAPNREALLTQVATWQAPLRDIQIHGFAMTMILGVSQRFFPGMLGFPEISKRRSLASLIAIFLGVAGETAFFIVFRKTGQHLYAGVMYGFMLIMVAGVVGLTSVWWTSLWGKPDTVLPEMQEDRADRSFKFIRTAYGWLYVSLALLLFVPFYNVLTRQPFSHAYYGATRHAITVGFISLMIMGVAAKVVPVLNGVDSKNLSKLWLPFILVNTGCTLRVGVQILTDLIPGAFVVIGLSGVLEVAGIGIWAGGIWRVMRSGVEAFEPRRETLLKSGSVTPLDKVGDVVMAAPELIEVFVQFGFKAIRNPVLRRTVARQTSIRQACKLQGIDEAELLNALNSSLKPNPAS